MQTGTNIILLVSEESLLGDIHLLVMEHSVSWGKKDKTDGKTDIMLNAIDLQRTVRLSHGP